jgi:hypothetical protein
LVLRELKWISESGMGQCEFDSVGPGLGLVMGVHENDHDTLDSI